MNRLTRRRQVPIVSMPHLASTKNHSTGRTSSTITKTHTHSRARTYTGRLKRGGRDKGEEAGRLKNGDREKESRQGN